jgi:hypothetical protein
MPRLPQPGGDNGNWGQILNDFLSQSIDNDGSLKPTAVASSIPDNAITVSKIPDGEITQAKVTNLTTDLANKADALHAHTASNITDFNSITDARADQRIAAANITALNDVVIASPSNGQVLKYNGSQWVNDTDDASGGTPGSIWHSGSGVPGAGLGVINDFYLNTTNGDVYSKASGSWAFQNNLRGPTGSVGPSASVQQVVFSRTGTLTVSAGTAKLVFAQAGAISGIRLAIGIAPAGADLICDVNLNGNTIFTTQGNRPTITAGNAIGTLATPDVTAVSAGDYITIDVDQIGSSTAGTDLSGTILFGVA